MTLKHQFASGSVWNVPEKPRRSRWLARLWEPCRSLLARPIVSACLFILGYRPRKFGKCILFTSDEQFQKVRQAFGELEKLDKVLYLSLTNTPWLIYGSKKKRIMNLRRKICGLSDSYLGEPESVVAALVYQQIYSDGGRKNPPITDRDANAQTSAWLASHGYPEHLVDIFW